MGKLLLAAVIGAIVIVAAVMFLPADRLNISAGRETTPDVVFDIVVRHTRYEPGSISVEQGQVVQLNLLTAQGTETYGHGLNIDSYSIKAAIDSASMPTVVKFTADKKGTFSGYCSSCLNGPFGADVPDKRLTLIVS